MKIGIDISLLGGEITGIGVYIKDMLRYFKEHDSINEYILYSNLDITDFSVFPHNSILRVRKIRPHLLWQIIVLPSMLRKDKVDIFWEPNHRLPIMFDSVKYVVTVHDLAAYLHPEYVSLKTYIQDRLFLKKTIKHADKVIAISKYTKDSIVKFLGVSERNIEVIYNGDTKFDMAMNFDDIKWRDIKEKYSIKRFLLYVGNIHPRKNVSVILDAYEKACEADKDFYQLVIVGNYLSQVREMKTKILNSKFKNKIIVTGYIPDDILYYLYKKSEALVFPSRYEGFGLPVLEAMSLGTLVITSKVTSLPEVAGDAAIYLNDIDSSDELKQIFLNLKDMSVEVKSSLVMRGYEQVKKFSRKICAKETLKLFHDLSHNK